MEIEKICRTCLGLSGPLLSIYDGGGTTSCLADMLSDFTKTKPQRADNMPESVCLGCISEINRCYSFKLKCENSNRTLRQLLPNALPEKSAELKCETLDKSMQTEEEAAKQTATAAVQTIVEQKNQQVQADVQTSDASTSPDTKRERKPNIYKKLKLEHEIDNEIPLEELDTAELVVVEDEGEEEFIGCHQAKAVDTAPNMKLVTTKKRRRDKCFDVEEEEQSGNEIVLELDDVADVNDNEREIDVQVHPKSQAHEDDNANESYYEISYTRYNYDDEGTAVTEAEPNVVDETEQEQEYDELNYIDGEVEESGAQDPPPHYDFSICNNENGEEEIVAKKPSQASSKLEYECTSCLRSFANLKTLNRHISKEHVWKLRPVVSRKSKESALPKGMETELEILKSEVITEKNAQSDYLEIAIADSQPPAKKETQTINTATASTVKLTYFCENCNAGFALFKSLKYHRKQNACTVKNYCCHECDRVFNSEENLKEHMASHVLVNVCTECTKVFKTKDDLSQHMFVDHKRNQRNQCVVCKKIFTMLSALKDHMRVHSGEKPYLCPLCGKGFSQNANLKQHVMRHSNEKKFKCDFCNSSFVTKAEMFTHKRTHTGDQPYSCDFCSSSFTTSSSLAKHKRKHTGERPYACDICPMRFTALNVLKNHRRTHTGEKPYKCSYCKKAFTQKGDCHIHERTHTGERNYVCYCNLRFAHLSTLRSHMKNHDNETVLKNTRRQQPTRKKKSAPAAVATHSNEEEVQICVIDDDDDDQVNDDGSQLMSVQETEAATAASGDDELMELAMEDMC